MRGLLTKDRALVADAAQRGLLADTCAAQCCGVDFRVLPIVNCCDANDVYYVALVDDPNANTPPATFCRTYGDCVQPPLDHPRLLRRFGTGAASCWLTDPANIVNYSTLTTAQRARVWLPIRQAQGTYTDSTCLDAGCDPCPSCCIPAVLPGCLADPPCCACGEDHTLEYGYTFHVAARFRPQYWANWFSVMDENISGVLSVHYGCELIDGVWTRTASVVSDTWTRREKLYRLRYQTACAPAFIRSVSRVDPPIDTQDSGDWGGHILKSPDHPGCAVALNQQLPQGSSWYQFFNESNPQFDGGTVTRTGDECNGSYDHTTPAGTYWRRTWSSINSCQSGQWRDSLSQVSGGTWDAYCTLGDECQYPNCDGSLVWISGELEIVGTKTIDWTNAIHRPCANDPCGTPTQGRNMAIMADPTGPMYHRLYTTVADLRAIALGA